MPARFAFEYAVIRVVPRVERGEFVNAGAVLFCEERDYLVARVELDEARLRALAPDVDLDVVRTHLAAIPRVCAGDDGGPIGRMAARDRFRWIVAPRSTILQTSPAHGGLCDAPDAALERILATIVRLPA